jgi:hypothetical protein
MSTYALGFEPFLVLPLGCIKQRSPSCRLGVSEPILGHGDIRHIDGARRHA